MIKQTKSSPPSWDSLLQSARDREAPIVDVRHTVRAQLQREQHRQPEDADFLAMLCRLAFSRAGQFTYAVLALMLVFTGVVAWMEHSGQVDPDNDHVVAFIEDGDWSDWL